jgi:asparagine synthase (glutamine-hydrolysing)
MCGICGIIKSTDREIRDSRVKIMNKEIFHRGPDDEGFYSDVSCSLAMRRLSIIDLDSGKQPIFSECRNFIIFFNGEIYNYKSLKQELEKLSCIFYTKSDTEVVVNLYKYFGKKMLPKLHGMFAFCIYDIKHNSYFFARDKFGEKPFYYYYDKEKFLFSSEIKSLIASKEITPKLNKVKIGSYVRMGYVEEPYTLLQNVYTLQPGSYLELNEKREIFISEFSKIVYSPDNSIRTIQDAANFINPFFEKAIFNQLVSDVPVGAFLSGGIDSSSIVAKMAKMTSSPINTFTVKFQTKGYDESQIANLVSKRYNTKHHQIVVENSKFKEEQFWKILDHVGLPFPDSSAIPTDLVSQQISKYVKVAISGDGGDELFGGYTVFDWLNKIQKISKLPYSFRSLSLNTFGFLNKQINSNKLRQIIKVLKISNLDDSRLIQETHALFDNEESNSLLLADNYFPHFAYNKHESILRNSMRYRLKYDLPLDMLVKVDRMSMKNSLEVRSPFLDPNLFEASCKLPDRFIRSNGVGKLVIREMMKDDLPDEVFNHPKSGFSIPLHDFRNSEFKSLAKKLIFSPEMLELFDKNTLNDILYSGLNDENNDGSGSIYRKMHQLWSLMMLSGWIIKYNVKL